MTSSQNNSETPEQASLRRLSTASKSVQWDDVTDVFNSARSSMGVGEMIHSPRFTLFTAMSAIELMDPKMDVGVGIERDIRDVFIPDTLTDIQVINIMDRLLACEMSWLNSHTLPQTVFSCVYTQKLENIPRTDLFTFIRLQLATMDCAMSLILEERVAEDEDFISWTFGFRLPGLECQHSGNEEEYILRMLAGASVSVSDQTFADAILLRLRLHATFYRALRWLAGHSSGLSPFDAVQLVDSWSSLVESWARCPYRHEVDEQFLDVLFDPSINRHLLTSTPPCTAPLLNQDSACNYLRNLVTEIRALLALRDLALPPDKSQVGSPRYSFHVVIHAMETYCAKYRPQVLTRSLMARLMLMVPERSSFLFDNEGAEFAQMVATDMGLGAIHDAKHPARAYLDAIRNGVVAILQCFCRNRSRQRQQILRAMRSWDISSISVSLGHLAPGRNNGLCEANESYSGNAPENSRMQSVGSGDSARNTAEEHSAYHRIEKTSVPPSVLPELTDTPVLDLTVSDQKSPLELVALEVSCRLLVQHFLLGFECELYHEFEYNYVFYNVGCILTCLHIATTSLAQCGIKGAILHPLRFSLYLMDDARATLCHALSMALSSLSEGPQWRYTSRRDQIQQHSGRQMFGSESLWYEQRFAITLGLHNAPPYFTYPTFESMAELQDKKLLRDNPSGDILLLRIKEAAKLFLQARRKLEKAKKSASTYNPNMLPEEILKLGQVAIGNSLTMSHIMREYSPKQTKESAELYTVSFSFVRHHHFPVVKVEQIK